MSSTLRAVWENIVGLVVEDSQLALGIVAALLVTWVLAAIVEPLHGIIGWLLVAMLVAALLLNVAVTASRARRRIAAPHG